MRMQAHHLSAPLSSLSHYYKFSYPVFDVCGVAVSRGKAGDGEREAVNLRWAMKTGTWAEVSDSRT
jgi:hypothetical protein